MKKYLGNASLGALVALGLVLSASVAGAATMSVTGWVGIFDLDSDFAFVGGSEATQSPSHTDAQKEAIAADIGTNTLTNDGDFVKLTGSVSFSLGLPSDGQFRWGLFDRGGGLVAPVTTPSGYVGYWAEAPATTLIAQDLKAAAGSGNSPFSGTTVDLADPSAGNIFAADVAANAVLDFVLTIVKNGANADVSASISGETSYFAEWSVSGVAASPGSLTYDSVSFLTGGGMLPDGQANYRNIEVTTGNIPEPASFVLLGISGVLFCGMSRR